MSALLALAAAMALAAGEGDGAGEPAERPVRAAEGSDAANAARAKAGLLPRKRAPRAPEPRAAEPRAPAPEVVPAVASLPAEPRGWLRVIVDAARALEASGDAGARSAPATAAIEDVRARAMGLRVDGRLSVRLGGVMLGAASMSGEGGSAAVAPARVPPPTPTPTP